MPTQPFTPAVEVEAKSSPATARERIVFALAPESRSYYSRFLASAQFDAEVEWLDISDLDARGWEKALFSISPTVLVTGWGTPSLTGPFARFPELPLRYVCHLAGSVKNVVPRHMIEKGLLVSNWGTVISHTVAEHAMLLVLGTLRTIKAWDPFLQRWPENDTPFVSMALKTRTLRGKRVGLHGFGAIARELAQMLRPFQVTVSSYSHGVPLSLFEEHGVHSCQSLEELFSGNDIIIECEALTRKSHQSITEEVLRLLPHDAVFINVGRAPIVVESALERLAAEGRLRIGLDVYHHEPLHRDSRLRQIPNALLSPHIAGPTEDSFPMLAQFALHNIRQYLHGAEIDGRVTMDIYDRST
jgi:phosphoglycerate dehydrogenase-like enzyme